MKTFNRDPIDFSIVGDFISDKLTPEENRYIWTACEMAFRRGYAHGAGTAIEDVDPKNYDKFLKAIEKWRFPKKKQRFLLELPAFERFFKNG